MCFGEVDLMVNHRAIRLSKGKAASAKGFAAAHDSGQEISSTELVIPPRLFFPRGRGRVPVPVPKSQRLSEASIHVESLLGVSGTETSALSLGRKIGPGHMAEATRRKSNHLQAAHGVSKSKNSSRYESFYPCISFG